MLPKQLLKNTLAILTFCFGIQISHAQKKETFYDINWKPCDASAASYYSLQQKTDSGCYQQDYFINGLKPQMFALFEDANYKINNGYALYFYASGIPQHLWHYVHGKFDGVIVSYHPNGVISDSGIYRNGEPVGNVFKWHSNGFMSDSIARIKDSSFVHVTWFDDGSVASAGRETNGKPYGPWTYYRRNGSKASSEMYEKGERISVKQFDETGNETALDTSKNEHPAEFKGGVIKWRSYLERALKWPDGLHFENVYQVVLQVQMTIDEQGNITDVYVVNPFHPKFDQIAFDAISKGPKWIPAIQHNRPVKYRFVQSVTFAER